MVSSCWYCSSSGAVVFCYTTVWPSLLCISSRRRHGGVRTAFLLPFGRRNHGINKVHMRQTWKGVPSCKPKNHVPGMQIRHPWEKQSESHLTLSKKTQYALRSHKLKCWKAVQGIKNSYCLNIEQTLKLTDKMNTNTTWECLDPLREQLLKCRQVTEADWEL